MKRRIVSAFGIGAAVCATAANAHHSIAGVYDDSRRVTVEGVITRFQFVNPHPWVQMEVREANGSAQQWTLEMDNRHELVDIGFDNVTLKPGESKQIEVHIDRAPGFDKNITLDVTYNHLEQIHADSLPRGVKLERGKSQTLLTGANSKGIITLTAAKDAAAAERQQAVVLANVSINFVMKATYCSAPIQVTVVAP